MSAGLKRALWALRNAPLPERMSGRELKTLAADWSAWGREAQREPKGDWSTWVMLGGRGGGKTRAGAQWVEAQAQVCGRIALVGQSLHDVREVMVEGPAGLRALPRPGPAPRWEASRRRLVWDNGAVAEAFSAEDAEALRGPQFSAAWADEWCAWRKPADTLALLRMGLRSGSHPQLVITTTPRPTRALKALLAEPGVVRTDLPTRANAAHLAPSFLAGLEAVYGGTRLAAQELDGQVVDAPGALFTSEMFAVETPPLTFDRVVVGVDPPCSADGDACGIVAAGRRDGKTWVLADRTAAGLSPHGWAEEVARAARDFGAARVVAEANQGGEMVEAVLKAANVPCPVRRVHARIGKRARAEPVAALYEQGRVRHARRFAELEEELMGLGDGDLSGGASPDRADALVWAVTELMLESGGEEPRIRVL